MTKKVYQQIASCLQAMQNCREAGNDEWFTKHADRIKALVETLPSGSGFDHGTTLDVDRSTSEKLVFHTSYHHMDENGFYSGWTDHDVIVRPSLAFGFDLKITGRNWNDIKDYIHECFHDALSDNVPALETVSP